MECVRASALSIREVAKTHTELFDGGGVGAVAALAAFSRSARWRNVNATAIRDNARCRPIKILIEARSRARMHAPPGGSVGAGCVWRRQQRGHIIVEPSILIKAGRNNTRLHVLTFATNSRLCRRRWLSLSVSN